MIVRYPHNVLVEPTQKVDFSRDDVKRLSEDMFKELEQAKGVGLAANQFSDLTALSMFVVNFKHKEELFTEVFINPELVGHSNETTTAPEMCLSFPGISVNKERWKQLTLRWLDLEGKEHQETFEGFRAVVIQHELDHCCGKTIISSLPALKQKMLVEKMRKNLKKKNRKEALEFYSKLPRLETTMLATDEAIPSVRQRAKELGIVVRPEDGQERLDIETGKRMSDE